MDRPGTEPPYRRIVAEIRRRIVAGELRPGDRVPSTRQITAEWGVAMATATKVLTALREAGLVRAVPGVGTVVAEPDPEPPPAARGGRRRMARDPDPGLTRERIVHTAIEVADAEGFAALSMRQVAIRLGVGTMALYRHVPSRDDLVALMVEEVLDKMQLPETPPPGWRAQLELITRLRWAVFRQHPWMHQTMSLTRPMLSPQGMAQTDWTMRAVDGLGLDTPSMFYIVVSTAGFAHGMAANLVWESEAEQESGLTDEEWMANQDSTLNSIFESGAMPMLARLAEIDLEFDLDRLFEFGLQRMLDGVAVFIEGRSSALD
ncbi:TetR/AcrR family transcriptional regulator C-terminal domain-containing protein [Plantactinospora soyae]|uniref:DNA-binding transcriptional regulator YhcF (GntR family) n=1 Tax=Plantactinospora soyae TaxID=1544732 RepID=A0A927M476_9ACTN|nr:TetR/AcrR family transcriptional regulator C-terminal domain-containing protein [Plantactinospora soyae]MBE1486351.1 DNA-binding transcriptional regulator YhcF (GntR family) [Plantactinospora soyae]